MAEKAILSRKELYEKVWAKPMAQLAKEFGISDRGLAKICQRYSIPRPGLGYWAKLQHGKKVEKKSLPDNDKLDKEQIVINTFAEYTANQWAKKHKVYMKYAIPVTSSLSKIKELHPMVAETLKAGFGKADKAEMCNPKKSCFSIAASQASIQRSLMLIDTIIKAVENRGHKLKTVTEKRELYCNHQYAVKYCYFEIKGEQVHFSLREKLIQIEHKPNSDCGWKDYGSKWDYKPSGKLEFIVSLAYSCDYRWKDAEKKKLEDKLSLILKGILKAADSYKKKRILERIRTAKEAEERRKAWEKELQRRKERECLDGLMSQVDNWQKARLIRQFLKAAEKTAIHKNGQYAKDSEFSQWLAWANNYADSIDPLNS
jgi:hypothetical protein